MKKFKIVRGKWSEPQNFSNLLLPRLRFWPLKKCATSEEWGPEPASEASREIFQIRFCYSVWKASSSKDLAVASIAEVSVLNPQKKIFEARARKFLRFALGLTLRKTIFVVGHGSGLYPTPDIPSCILKKRFAWSVGTWTPLRDRRWVWNLK